jgi:cation:H+ antiporter
VAVLGVGAGSLVICVVYLAGSRAIFLRSSAGEAAAAEVGSSNISLRMAVIGFAMAAAAILVAAPRFAHSAEALATLTGLGNTFVGTWILGVATSLPELVTTIAAVRLRAIDLAIGNLYGSNCFNMVLFVALDVANGGNPVLAMGDPNHAISALIAIVLMATGMAAIVFRAGRRFGFMEPSSAVMALTYVAAVLLLYARRGE